MKWKKRDAPAELVRALSARYGCGLLDASILVRRGVLEGPQLLYFLETEKRHLRLPFELPGMEGAVERILQAREESEKVLIFGDRDVDGVTSTTLLAEFLAEQGMDVSWRVPMGDETYGLSREAVDEFAAEGGTLIITVDCGISNGAEVAYAGELGVDVVVTDHHNPQAELPAACAIVNPKLKGADGQYLYPFPDLAGCAVAYKLVSALRFASHSSLYGQPLCLLNAYPANDAVVIEVLKIRNLVIIGRLEENVVPGVASISDTRLPAFLEGQQIFTWDAATQKKTLARCFGKAVEINMLDLAPEIGKLVPGTLDGASGQPLSLLRLREKAKTARYAAKTMSEVEVLHNLFVSFVQKREGVFNEEDDLRLQLVAVGTIGDLMPLRDENRILVRRGVSSLAAHARRGLSELLYKLNLAGRPRLSTTVDVSWRLSPALNAAGRMGVPDKAVMLLLESDPAVRDRLAADIIALNEERKNLGDKIWLTAEPQAAQSLETYTNFTLAAGEDIPRGLTGVVANNLVKRFSVPAIVVSQTQEVFIGSLRSARGYDLTHILDQIEDLCLDHGGHNFAAGFSMAKENWAVFLERLAGVAKTIEFPEAEAEPSLVIDAELPLAYMTPDLLKTVDLFEPYGKENEELLFMAKGLKITQITLLGRTESKHVKLSLSTGKHIWPALYWNAAEKVGVEFNQDDKVDAAFRIRHGYYNGQETPELVITALRPAGSGDSEKV